MTEKFCPNCKSKRTVRDVYTRAWNDLCDQAAGERGYYCMDCGYIDYDTPNLDTWLGNQPQWIVLVRGTWKNRPLDNPENQIV